MGGLEVGRDPGHEAVPLRDDLLLAGGGLGPLRDHQGRAVDGRDVHEDEVPRPGGVELRGERRVQREDVAVQGLELRRLEPPRVPHVVDADPEREDGVGAGPGGSSGRRRRVARVARQELRPDLLFHRYHAWVVRRDQIRIYGCAAVR